MVAGIFRSGDYPYIDEVLLMGQDRHLTRMIRN